MIGRLLSKAENVDKMWRHLQMAAFTTTASESVEFRLYPAALMALTRNT